MASIDPLARFSPLTREWFTGTFAAPTAAQAEAWDAIAGGNNTLVIAPTGSGKTLAAFLWAIDQLAAAEPRPPKAGTRVLYISPLKALAVDVERNLSTPADGHHPGGRTAGPCRSQRSASASVPATPRPPAGAS